MPKKPSVESDSQISPLCFWKRSWILEMHKGKDASLLQSNSDCHLSQFQIWSFWFSTLQCQGRAPTDHAALPAASGYALIGGADRGRLQVNTGHTLGLVSVSTATRQKCPPPSSNISAQFTMAAALEGKFITPPTLQQNQSPGSPSKALLLNT